MMLSVRRTNGCGCRRKRPFSDRAAVVPTKHLRFTCSNSLAKDPVFLQAGRTRPAFLLPTGDFVHAIKFRNAISVVRLAVRHCTHRCSGRTFLPEARDE